MKKVSAPVRIDISAGWSDADPFRREFGGAVLNLAIDTRVSAYFKNRDLIVSLGEVPSNSGLGTSGALRTVFLLASNPDLISDKIDLIKRVNVLENAIIGQRAGFQDQAAAIFGGANFWEFKKDGGIKRTEVAKIKAEHFLRRCVLVYTGKSHLSANVHQKVFEGKGFMKFIPVMEEMKEIARKMFKFLDSEKEMANLMGRTWQLQKMLSKSMESEEMKVLQEIAYGNYSACRCTGAGGGGCMIFYTDRKEKLRGIFRNAEKKIKGMRVIDFKIDYRGVEIE